MIRGMKMSKQFRYQGCGLDNVFLSNGYHETVSAAGEKSLFIENIEGLHKAIAQMIADDPAPLDAKTFKFLRKEMDMSQRQVSMICGVEEQTVSLWERARVPIPELAALMLKTLTKESCSGNAEMMRLIERMNHLDREVTRQIELRRAGDTWVPVELAA